MGKTEEGQVVLAEALERFGEGFRQFMTLPLAELKELRPEDREHLLEGFRKAGIS